MTNNSLECQAIIADIQNHMDGKTHVLEYEVENPDAAQQYLRKQEYRQRVVIRKVPEYRKNLVVVVKEETYTMKLERLLRRALMEIDNEELFEEILNAIDPTQK